LVGKVLDQADLLVAERMYLFSIHADSTDNLILLEHGHQSQREDAGDLNCGNGQWMAVNVRRIFSEISYLHRLPGLSNAAHGGCVADRCVPPQLFVCGWQVTMECSVAEAISFSEPHSAIARLAHYASLFRLPASPPHFNGRCASLSEVGHDSLPHASVFTHPRGSSDEQPQVLMAEISWR
jgi:hypothetical protein